MDESQVTIEELLKKYRYKLDTLKANRAETVDTNTDDENELFNRLIVLTAEVCSDLNRLIDTKEFKQRSCSNPFTICRDCGAVQYS